MEKIKVNFKLGKAIKDKDASFVRMVEERIRSYVKDLSNYGCVVIKTKHHQDKRVAEVAEELFLRALNGAGVRYEKSDKPYDESKYWITLKSKLNADNIPININVTGPRA